MKTKKDLRWLISITCILIIGSFVFFKGFPIFGGIAKKSLHIMALQHGKQIALAMRIYESNNGSYPTGTDANEALGKLVPNIESEKIFFVSNSPWHGTKVPDDRWETSEPVPGKALAAGENAYSLNRAATSDSPSSTPLLLTVSIDPEDDSRWLVITYANGTGETLTIEDHETYEPGSTTVLDRFPDADWLLPRK